MRWTIELNNGFDVRDIKASRCNISSNKDVDVSSAELIQSSLSIALAFVAMDNHTRETLIR
jgi:hypothetical protein